jgi:alpha-galactosidase
MRGALNRTGRPIALSIEPFSINPDPEQSVRVANVWRTGCDIGGNWRDIVNRADIADKWAPLAGPGGWNDPDSETRAPPVSGGLLYSQASPGVLVAA